MYGVPEDLPLDAFVGHECNQVALGQFQVQFHFAGAGSIFAESRWELRDRDGQLVDAACDHAEREAYRLHKLLGVRVARFSIDAPRSFTLHFQSGLALTVFDDSEQYESFSIHLDGQGDLYI